MNAKDSLISRRRLISRRARLQARIDDCIDARELASVLNDWDDGAARGQRMHEEAPGSVDAEDAHPVSGALVNILDLPAWDDEPANTEGVWSWDEDVIVVMDEPGITVEVYTDARSGCALLATTGRAWVAVEREDGEDLAEELRRDMEADLRGLRRAPTSRR